ncbi:MAG: MFS transporter [Sphingobium sp.]|nr:MFS transporter [Sphingobium sp.]
MSTTYEGAATEAPAAAAEAKGYPPSSQAWYTVGVLAVITTFALLDQNILGLLIQQIKTDFQLTDSEAGLLLGPTQAIFYALVAVPFSRYIDRWTRKWIIAGGLIIWSLATAASGLAANFTQLFVARVVVGAGESVNGPTAYSMVADSFPREKLPRAVSTLQLGTVAGSGLSRLLGGLIIGIIALVGTPHLPIVGELHAWQVVLLCVGLPGLVVSLLTLTLKEPPRHNRRLETRNAGFRVTTGYLWLHFAVFGPMFIGLTLGSLDTGSQAWGAAFFQRTYDWSPARYGIVTGLVSIPCMLLGLFLGARWAEWFQNRGDPAGAYRVILYTRLVAIPFAILQPMMPTPELAMTFSAVAYVSLGMTGPMLNAAMLAVSPNEIRGQIMTLYLFIYTVVGVGLGPYVTGLTTDHIFTSPDDLRWSIALLHIVFLPVSLGVTWLGLKAHRAEVGRLNQIDRQAE